MRYRAFLSYAHADRKWARWLHRKLEGYRVPRKLVAASANTLPSRISPVFRDRDDLPSTASLTDAVEKALSESEWLIVLCSPQAAASRWVNEEIRTFRKLGREDHILCFVVAGEPDSAGADECLPPALTTPDARENLQREPVAADARSHADGRTNALLKIVAGMLGIPYDALKRRDHTRHVRRLVLATAASLSVATLTVALAVMAVIARNQAEVRRAQAEDLVNFMLGDLQEQLREIGRLDLYQSIGDQALEYFARLSDEDVSDYTLAQRAKNFRQIGEVRQEQGDLSAALVAFEESRNITARLAERDADNAENQIGLAHSYFYIGSIYWQRGDLAQAQEQFEKVVPIVDVVSARNPDNPMWLLERGYGHTDLGRVLESEGDLNEALREYEIVLEINQQLAELEPENLDWKLELGFAHNNIGKLVTSLGGLEEAERNYRYDLTMKTEVLDTNPSHNTWRSYVAASQYFLGQLLTSKGDYPEAKQRLDEALENFVYLTTNDPQQVDWQNRLANVQRELARLLISQGDSAGGRERAEESVDLLSRLSAEVQDDASVRRDLTRSLIILAETAFTLEDTDSAAARLQQAQRETEALLEIEPTSRESQQLAIHVDICRGLILSSLEPETSRQSYGRALARLSADFGSSSDPYVLLLRKRALAGLGRSDESDEIADRLSRMGYVASIG